MRISTIISVLEILAVVVSVIATYLAVGIAGALYLLAAWLLFAAWALTRSSSPRR